MESVGAPGTGDRDLPGAMRLLLETFERAGTPLALNRDFFVETLQRVGSDPRQLPLMRGAAGGALWLLGADKAERLLNDLRFFADPQRLGDYLTGLFGLARETVQRDPILLAALDAVIVDYSDEQYLEALPALRLAFSFFTARERHHVQRTLWETRSLDAAQGAPAPVTLAVGAQTAAAVMAFESRLKRLIERYRLDWRPPDESR
jgi:hypothetical protein